MCKKFCAKNQNWSSGDPSLTPITMAGRPATSLGHLRRPESPLARPGSADPAFSRVGVGSGVALPTPSRVLRLLPPHRRPATFHLGASPPEKRMAHGTIERASPPARQRLLSRGGAVPALTSIAWDWQGAGPFVTSLVLETPRAENGYSVDLCMDDDPAPGLATDMELLVRAKIALLSQADSRMRVMMERHNAGGLEDLHAQSQACLGEFEELNTLKRRHGAIVRRIRATSEHLLHGRLGGDHVPVKRKSFKERLEALESKVQIYRDDPAPLRKRVKEIRQERKKEGGQIIMDFRQSLTAGAFHPDKMAEIRTLRMLQEEVKLLAVNQRRKQLLDQHITSTRSKFRQKEERKEAMRIENERKVSKSRNAAVLQVLLPAILAASRFRIWGASIQQQRLRREILGRLDGACVVIQRFFQKKLWAERIKQRAHAKRVLAKCLWRMLLNFRIRFKTRAINKIKAGLKDFGQTLEVVAAFKRYKYKIRILQRRIRVVLTSNHAQVVAAMRQYDRVRESFQDLQMRGGISSSAKETKEKVSARNAVPAHKQPRPPAKDINGVNFMLLPEASDAEVLRELTVLVKARRYQFALHVSHWRSAFAEWDNRKNFYHNEIQTQAMMGIKLQQDYSQESMPTDAITAMCMDRDGAMWTWGRFIALDEAARFKDGRYRQRGPPRPLFNVALSVDSELFPLFERIMHVVRDH